MRDVTRDDDLSPTLREAYRQASPAPEPSPQLWQRTRRALSNRGLLRSHASIWRWRGLAAALALVGFSAGFLTGFGSGAHQVGPEASSSPSTLPLAATRESEAERLQGAGTAYTAALESLVRSLGNNATAAELGAGLEVVLATDRAQLEARRILLASRPVGREAAWGGDASSETLIWF